MTGFCSIEDTDTGLTLVGVDSSMPFPAAVPEGPRQHSIFR